MPLNTGTRLGPYEILSPIGAGGPPSLARETSASFGASTVAMERTCL